MAALQQITITFGEGFNNFWVGKRDEVEESSAQPGA
jgi:hypothetical protein